MGPKQKENRGVTHKVSYITSIETFYLWLKQYGSRIHTNMLLIGTLLFSFLRSGGVPSSFRPVYWRQHYCPRLPV